MRSIHFVADHRVRVVRRSELVDARSMAAPGRVRPITRVEALRMVLRAHVPRWLHGRFVFRILGGVASQLVRIRFLDTKRSGGWKRPL